MPLNGLLKTTSNDRARLVVHPGGMLIKSVFFRIHLLYLSAVHGVHLQ